MQEGLTTQQKKSTRKSDTTLFTKNKTELPVEARVAKPSLGTVDEIVKAYLPYATSIASKVVKTLSSDVDFDDVLCNARLGLLEAAQRYDSSQGVDFKTFSYYRVKGAIYDGLRKTGWLPRSLYTKMRFEQAANEYMETQYSVNVKVNLENELNEIADTVNSLASIYVMSFEGHDDIEIEDKEAKKDIEHRAEFQKIKQQICDAIESLPDKERKLIKMYYFQNKTLEEIGEQLDLSKSWTSRLHVRSLEILFKKIAQLSHGDVLS